LEYLLGGNGNDRGYAIAVDGSGNVYVGGYSDATWGSPKRDHDVDANNDAFAAKLDSAGSLVWNTFLGGNGNDRGYAIAVDGSGNVYIGGYSYATWGTPMRAYTAGGDAFAAKLDSASSLVWNTFLGGNGLDGGNAIAVDSSGNAHVGGYSYATWGSPMRAHDVGDNYDAFAAKLDSSGALVWNTFLGGSGYDNGQAIMIDVGGNAYVSGYSDSTWGSPMRAHDVGDNYDAFAAKLDSSGALVWNTFLGGNGYDYGYAIAVDSSGNVHVGGYSDAIWGSPVRDHDVGANYDAFAAKLDSAGSLVWNTFLGGSNSDYGYAIAVDGSGNVYIGGNSYATWGSPMRAHDIGANYDAFAARGDHIGNFTPSWASNTDPSRADPEENTFASPNTIVYMRGTSFANVEYLIAYYDANGVKRGSETHSASSGILNSAYVLTSDPTAARAPGMPSSSQAPAITGFGTNSITTITASPATYGLLADDSFTVESDALPELPTVMAGIFVTSACAGTYWWMRKRSTASAIGR